MKKFLKRFALLLMCAVTIGAFGLLFAACDKASNTLEIKVVYADGTAVAADSVTVQICVIKANGSTGTCIDPAVAVDENGVAKFDIAKITAVADSTTGGTHEFHIQVNKAPEGYGTGTEYDYGKINVDEKQQITITLIAIPQ